MGTAWTSGIRRFGAALAIGAVLAIGHGVAAGGGHSCRAGKTELAASKAFDEQTGRDLRNFPPDRIVDWLHMTLRLRFEDLDQRRFDATQMLRFAPIGSVAPAVRLDAVGLDIRAVTMDGAPVEHFHDGEVLTLRFDPPIAAGASAEITIEYACVEPQAGMIFTPSAPGYTAEVHTQGQTEDNRHWFPCHDFPNEMMTTELIVEVPAGLSVSANGRLVRHAEDGSRALWHYVQDRPHVSYLVSLVIGTFDIVELDHDRVPMAVWVPPGQADRVEAVFGRTGEMLDVFEARLGVAYPWARYDQVLAKNFAAGGMENTSVTTLYPSAALDEIARLEDSEEGLIAHELGHQWTGDLITCKSWAHIWLNEGWATYCEALWREHGEGPGGYLDEIRNDFRVAERDRTTNALPMVSPIYESSWEPFDRAADPYAKGASILHMLRMMLGDDVFFEGVRRYVNAFAGRTVETADFRYVMEAVSGRGLEWFFDQWCYRPGTPELAVDVRYDPAIRELTVDVEQVQAIDDRTPAFRFELPVLVRTAGGDRTFAIDVRERQASHRAALDGPPQIVAIDPHLHVLKTIETDKAFELWLAQARHGPTLAARAAALDGLAAFDTAQSVEYLDGVIRDGAAWWTLRTDAVATLAGYGSRNARAAILAIARDGVADPRVRAAVLEAIRELPADDVVPVFAAVAAADPSYACRVAAIEGLAHHEAAAHADLVVELTRFPSQHEMVREAALVALADLDDPRGLDLAMTHAAYGNPDRARAAAVKVVGRLAHHDADRATGFLLACLGDPERHTVTAAGESLATLEDDRARAALETMARSHASEDLRAMAQRWLEQRDE